MTTVVRVRLRSGSFVALYKAILNTLPIGFPITPSSPLSSPFEEDEREQEEPDGEALEIPLAQRQPRLSLSAQAHQEWLRKKTHRWHAVIAGAVAGAVAITFEKRSRRVNIAQQLFVRSVSVRRCIACVMYAEPSCSGLQGSFNAFTSKRGIHIPHGDVLLFSLWCVLPPRRRGSTCSLLPVAFRSCMLSLIVQRLFQNPIPPGL